jgi:hypothetical protein
VGSHGIDQAAFRPHGFRQPTWFSRTTDGGATWEPPRPIYNPGPEAWTIGSVLNVLPNGDLVDGLAAAFFRDKRLKVRMVVIRSTDKGATWSATPVVVSELDTTFPGPYDPETGEPIRSGGLPDFAADPRSGRLYAVWEDDRPASGVDAIQFSQSLDGGRSWSAPIKVNKTPRSIPREDQQAFTPAVKVAGDGTVGVTYYDLRANTPAPGLPTSYWLVHCHRHCTRPAGWSESAVAGPFDEEQAAVAGGYFIGDYEGLVTIGRTFAPFFAQAIDRATNSSDVFFAKLAPASGGG